MSLVLIIASAFSAFGQYLGNHHKSEMDALRHNLEKCDFPNKDHNQAPWNILKGSWDDLMTVQPISPRRQIAWLGIFMLASILIIAANALLELYMPQGQAALLKTIQSWTIFSLAIILFCLCIWLFATLWQMRNQEREFQIKQEKFLGYYEAVQAGLNANVDQTSAASSQRETHTP